MTIHLLKNLLRLFMRAAQRSSLPPSALSSRRQSDDNVDDTSLLNMMKDNVLL